MAAKTTLRLNKTLCDRAREHAERAGYSSVEEFVAHVLERELARQGEADSREDVENKLKGLGYLE